MTRSPHIFFHVQHLLGIGHMKRAEAIMAACLERGCKVTVATGSERVPSLDRDIFPVELPDVKAKDISFSAMVSPTGAALDPEFWHDRARILLEGFKAADADILVIEGFPFARRQFRRELLPIIEHARSQTVPVVCSLRDIIQPKGKPDRLREVVDWANNYFDAVMVHGDPTLVTLDVSFPRVDDLKTPLIYTGYVNQGDNKPQDRKNNDRQRSEIIASAGGGAAGKNLYEAAIAAAQMEKAPDTLWRVLVGPHNAGNTRFVQQKNLIVEPIRQDFQALLKDAALSISQAGYNTCVDLFRTKTPAILVPAAEGGQLEQTIRANLLAKFPGFETIGETEITGPSLYRAAHQSLGQNRVSSFPDVDLDGASRTVDILTAIIRGGPKDAEKHGLG